MGEYQALLRWYQANGTVPVEDAQGRAARRVGRPREGRHVPPRGREVLREQPDPAGAAGPVRDVRADERERDELPRVPPRHAVLLEQPRERRRRPVAHVRHGHAVGAERALPGHGPRLAGREHRGEQRRDLAVRLEPPERRHGRLRAAEREVRRHRSAGEPAALQPHGLGAAARAVGRRRTSRPTRGSTRRTYSPVHPAGTAVEAQESSHEDEASIFWNLGIPGFSVGGVQDSNIDENPYPSTVCAAIRSTPILAVRRRRHGVRARERRAGGRDDDARRPRPRSAPRRQGRLRDEPDRRPAVLRRHRPQPRDRPDRSVGLQRRHGVTLTAPLALAHASGVPFNVNQGQPVGFTGDTVEHLNFFASGAPHGLGGETVADRGAPAGARAAGDSTRRCSPAATTTSAPCRSRTGTVAYFETDPVNPTSTLTVTFDASFARARRRRHGGPEVLLGLRRRHARHRRDRLPHLRVAACGPT